VTTTVPRRHRRANREAEQNLEDEFTALEHAAGVELAKRPTSERTPRERVPWHQRTDRPVARPVMKDPKGETTRVAKAAANLVAHHATHGDVRARTFGGAVNRGARRAGRRVRDYVRMPKRQLVLERLVAEGDSKKHAKFAARYEQRRRRNLKRVATGAGIVAGVWLAVVVGVALWLCQADVDVDAGLLPDLGTFGWRCLVANVPLVSAVLADLAVYGRDRDKAKPAEAPVAPAGSFRVSKSEPKLSADLVHQAFLHAGIEGVVVEETPRREGPGYETLLRIPIGTKTFRDAAKVAPVIAGNLGITTERLFLDPVKGDRGSEKLVRLWRADTDPMAGDPPPHPLLDPSVTEWDLWTRGVPLGVDPRGKQVCFPVVDTPFGVVGALPTAGKTFTMFDVAVPVGLDALFDLDCISFKASDDFKPLKPLVKACGGAYIVGTDEKAFEAFHKYLVRMRAEYVARYTRLGQLPIEAVPHGKVTRALAMDPRMGMRPRVALVDEIQTALLNPVWGKRILDEVVELARTVRALNFWMLCGMQFVKADNVEALVSLLGFRFALSVARWQDSQGILGAAHTPGVADASEIPLSRKGVGIVAGAEDDPNLGSRPAFKMRTYGIDRIQLAAHVQRCLTGPRAGQTPSVHLAKAGDPAAETTKARLRQVLNGDEALTLKALGERLELGEGPVAAKKAAEQARAAGIEPRKDTTGRVTGSREALYIHRDQLN
jgi:hypothetical protein